MEEKLKQLSHSLENGTFKFNEPLKLHTTVAIGGPADLFYEPNSTESLINAVKKAEEHGIPVTMFGWGSNTLVGDRGIRGLVIKNNSKEIKINEEPIPHSQNDNIEIEARWNNSDVSSKYDFKDLDYDESSFPRVEVEIDSGINMPYCINILINKGITGLQWYGRIPGSLGGWIYNNTHGGTHFISEIVTSVKVLNENLEVIELKKEDLEFGYDFSRFHKTKEVILSAKLLLYKGDKEKAIYVLKEWAKRKAIQPQKSLGCIFKNITNEEKERFGFPTTSVGYIVEHELNLSGFRVGDASISKAHHAFIENTGNATAKDYLEVINTIKSKAKEKLNLELETEIVLLGEF